MSEASLAEAFSSVFLRGAIVSDSTWNQWRNEVISDKV